MRLTDSSTPRFSLGLFGHEFNIPLDGKIWKVNAVLLTAHTALRWEGRAVGCSAPKTQTETPLRVIPTNKKGIPNRINSSFHFIAFDNI